MKVSDYILDYLKNQGIKHAFLIIGGFISPLVVVSIKAIGPSTLILTVFICPVTAVFYSFFPSHNPVSCNPLQFHQQDFDSLRTANLILFDALLIPV